MIERDGSVRIAWSAEDYRSIRVAAPRRDRDELDSFARDVADAALLNRDLATLRSALRERRGATFDLEARESAADLDAVDADYVLVTMHPPPGEPNPD